MCARECLIFLISIFDKIDYINKTVTFGYKKIAMLNGKTTDIESCSYKSEPTKLKATYDGCDIKNDIYSKVSTPTQKYYYELDGRKVFTRECENSSLKFEHFTTKDTCGYKELGNGRFMYEERTAFKDLAGIVRYVDECHPDNKIVKIDCGNVIKDGKIQFS